MKEKIIKLNDEVNTKFNLTICNDNCGNDRFNVHLQLLSDEFGGRVHCIMKNVMNEHKANIIFNSANKDNIILIYELMN